MDRIVVFGGYGAVGREAATALAEWFPGAVVAAGRDLAKARTVTGAIPLRADLGDDADVDRALDGAGAVLMCADRHNVRVARACLARGVHYVDVSAFHPVLAAVERLDGLARGRSATAVLSVGLAPGATNLLARHCVDSAAGELAGSEQTGTDHAGAEQAGAEQAGADSASGGGIGGARPVRIGVLIGAGERHGSASIAWTLDGLLGLGSSSRMRFPPPYGTRTVHHFPFSDQHTLSGTLGAGEVTTGLCLDSRVLTAALGAARLPGVSRLLRRPGVRAAVLTALTRVRLGGDGFAVTVASGGRTASLRGRRQSRATGLAAALVVRRLDALPAGVWHIDEVVPPAGFLAELAEHGFTLDLGAAHYDAR